VRTLWQLVHKELLVLRRDAHALALLFVMPAFFILVMSLALRDVFARDSMPAFTYYLDARDTTPLARELAGALRRHRAFREVALEDAAERARRLRRGGVDFAVTIPDGFVRAVTDSQPRQVRVQVGPGVSAPAAQLFLAALREAVSGVYLQARLMASAPLLFGPAGTAPSARAVDGTRTSALNTDVVAALIAESSVDDGAPSGRRPTSVQQNVPAWLVFAMFFVALPLSTTWTQERTQGTLIKLRSMGIPSGLLLAGKLVPYLLVNLGQVVVMLAVGVWGVPAFGGDALTLGHSWAGLILVAVAVGAAAVSYALLIANLVATTEQATILTGASNLLLGALGGVMVPRSIMPEGLQRLSNVSPMSWGLEGFLDILLREGDLRTVAPRVLLLVGFAAAALLLASWRMRRPRPL